MRMTRWGIGIVFMGFMALSQAWAAREVVTLKGSDTLVILAQRWAEAFMKDHPDAAVQVTGGGSGTGISALINGSTDIAMASRPISRKEEALLKKKRGADVVAFDVAKDGITIYVHPDNPVKALSLEQLASIYTGGITDWKEVGGRPGRIILYGRENSSGTYVYFMEHVLDDEDYDPRMQSLPGTAAVVNAVSKEPRGIGYGGAAYASGVKIVPIGAGGDAPAYRPTPENVAKGLYPISRTLYFYTAGAPTPQASRFLDWVRGPQGQELVREVGYFPISK